MNWIINTRTYGMKIRFTTPGDEKIDWVGDEIKCGKVKISMGKISDIMHNAVAEARRTLAKLTMMATEAPCPVGRRGSRREGGDGERADGEDEPSIDDVLPRIPWSRIEDRHGESTLGYSFLQDEANRPWTETGDEWVAKRLAGSAWRREAWISESMDPKFPYRGQAIREYGREVEKFRGLMWINSHNAYTLHRGLEGTTDPREIRSHSTTSERGGPLYTNCDSPGPDGAHATCRYSSEEDPLNVEDGVVLEAGESDTLHTARSQSKGSPSSSSLPSFSPHLGSTPPRTIAVPDSQGKSGANISAQSMRGDGDSRASDSGRSSPLSSLQEHWLQEPSLFVAVDEDEAGGTSDYSGSDRSTDEEDAPYREYGKRLRVKTVNNSKYSTAAAWVQAHMLDEPVCNTCLDEAGQVGRDDGLSLQEMATYIRDLGVPDALASSKPTTEGDQALGGGAEWRRGSASIEYG
ncbi:hypothetical protein EDB81DRAFT_895543 [Dactylonectria macrodidyma]|uniref:Uncharacterized protein n=1 Tax=Dactylonectria macrodidyma TaxID=307937 RepID=A0A9P9I6U2_9HYPO|nr:hypothetical protein EDB81DRAFT_895543 [Dactylonectria macrodidyma]